MSVLSDMQAELASPAHLEVAGDAIVRIRSDGFSETIQAIWNEDPPTEINIYSAIIGREIEQGERGVFSGFLKVLASQDIERGDKFEINGRQWQIAPHEFLGSISGAFRTIRLRSVEKVTTRENAPRLI
jgi:hypothetical protein